MSRTATQAAAAPADERASESQGQHPGDPTLTARLRGRGRREPDPGELLLRQDPAIRRHLRRASLAAAPTAALVVVQGLALAAVVVAVAQRGEFASAWAAALLGAATARGGLGWWLERSGRRAAAEAIGRLRDHVVGSAATLAATTPGALRAGEIATDVVQGLPPIESYVGRFLSARPAAGAITIAVLITMLVLDPVSAFVIAPTIPVLGVFMWLIGTESQAAADQRLASLHLFGAHLLDVLRGAVDLRAHGRAAHQRTQVALAAAAYRKGTMETLRSAFLSGLVLELVAMLGVALVAVFGGVRLAQGGAELAAVLPALVLAPELFGPMRRLGAGYHEAADARSALARLAEVHAAAAAAPVPGTPGGPVAPRPSDGRIVLDDVWVDGGDRGARLRGASLTLAPGEVTALVGESGAGKSTLALVALGLLAPSRGTVRAGSLRGRAPAGSARLDERADDRGETAGVDLATVDLDGWRARCAWVAQDPVLLPASLRDNARLAAPTADDAAVRSALAAAGLGGLLAELPGGLDTPLGDGAVRLSSGELRRLALARVVLSDADLIVLDEPTAQLDALTAERLLGTVEQLCAGRTTLLITHDRDVARAADRIVTLDDGRVTRVEAGTRNHGLATAARVALAAPPANAVASRAPASVGSLPAIPSDGPAAAARGLTAADPRMKLRTALRLIAPPKSDPSHRLAWRAVLLGSASAIAAVAVLALSGGLIVEAAHQPPVLELTIVIVLVRTFSILRAVGRYGERLASHDAALRALERVRVQVFTHVARRVGAGAPPNPSAGGQAKPASTSATSALDRAAGDVDRAADLLVRVVVPAVSSVAAITLAVLVGAIVDPAAAALIGLAAVVTGTGLARLALAAGRSQAGAHATRAALVERTVTALDAGTELLLAGRTADQRASIASVAADLDTADARHGTRAAALAGLLAVGSALTVVLLAALLAPSVGDGSLSGPLAAALMLGGLAAIDRLEGLTEAGLALPGATAAVARLAPALLEVIVDDEPGVDRAGDSAATGRSETARGSDVPRRPVAGAPALTVRGLAIERGGRHVLRDASLTVQPGERVAITGESGSGKSTLVHAIAGLLDASGGDVLVGGRPSTLGGSAERERRSPDVLLVPSAPHLLGGSIAANLRLAAPDATDRDLHRALAAVGLDDWVGGLPDGLDTRLGDAGVTASGGQRQRLGLARAYLSPAGVVLLDEPASHLPERDALDALRAVVGARPGRAAIVVSHRASERRIASREVRLEGGRIVDGPRDRRAWSSMTVRR